LHCICSIAYHLDAVLDLRRVDLLLRSVCRRLVGIHDVLPVTEPILQPDALPRADSPAGQLGWQQLGDPWLGAELPTHELPVLALLVAAAAVITVLVDELERLRLCDFGGRLAADGRIRDDGASLRARLGLIAEQVLLEVRQVVDLGLVKSNIVVRVKQNAASASFRFVAKRGLWLRYTWSRFIVSRISTTENVKVVVFAGSHTVDLRCVRHTACVTSPVCLLFLGLFSILITSVNRSSNPPDTIKSLARPAVAGSAEVLIALPTLIVTSKPWALVRVLEVAAGLFLSPKLCSTAIPPATELMSTPRPKGASMIPRSALIPPPALGVGKEVSQ
jgi:hypothetical protein